MVYGNIRNKNNVSQNIFKKKTDHIYQLSIDHNLQTFEYIDRLRVIFNVDGIRLYDNIFMPEGVTIRTQSQPGILAVEHKGAIGTLTLKFCLRRNWSAPDATDS